jgi:signal transduction histidine kinase
MDATAAAVPRAGWIRRTARWTLRWSTRVNPEAALLVAAIVAGITLLAVESPIGAVAYRIPLGLAFALAVLHCGSIPLAVVRPVLATSVAVPATVLLQVLGAQTGRAWPWWIVAMVTQTVIVFLIALRARWPVAVGAWLAPIVASVVVAAIGGTGDPDPVSVNVIVYASVSAAALVLAVVLAQWHHIRAQLIRERRVSAGEHSARVLVEDRARIARELHDVIAHSMSLIAVQAGTARYRNPEFGAAAIAEFDEIGASSRQALEEMRGLLGVLRHGDEPGDRRPQPRFPDIPELIAQADRAGMSVTFGWPADAAALPVSEVTGLAAYRIVQEALSNAIRHAPGASVEVVCRRAGDALELSVASGPAPSPAEPLPPAEPGGRSGEGIRGMVERAASVGGTVAATPEEDGGFVVRARLPLQRAVAR